MKKREITKKSKVERKAKPKVLSKEVKPVEIKISRPEPKKVIKPEPKAPAFKMFGIWETKGIQVLDQGLKRYITLDPVYLPYSQGRNIAKKFWKSDKPIVERLINKMLCSGHKGKKHWRASGHNAGKKLLVTKIVMEAFKIIEQKTKKNPVEVLIRAIETGAPREGITTIEYGGVKYPKAVDISPQRRIDLTLRWIAQGAYASAAAGRNVKKKIHMALAEQIMLTASQDNQANCIAKRFELERQAQASR